MLQCTKSSALHCILQALLLPSRVHNLRNMHMMRLVRSLLCVFPRRNNFSLQDLVSKQYVGVILTGKQSSHHFCAYVCRSLASQMQTRLP